MIANIQDGALPFGCVLFEKPSITEEVNFHLIYDRYIK